MLQYMLRVCLPHQLLEAKYAMQFFGQNEPPRRIDCSSMGSKCLSQGHNNTLPSLETEPMIKQ